jgi:glutamyl-tRNA synthetase
LGWAHGDDEIISMEQAIAWFSTDGIGKAPSRFDMDKLTNLNSHYIKIRDNDRLIADITPLLKDIVKRDISSADTHLLGTGIGELKLRAKTLHELADQASFYVKADEGLDYDNKAKKNLKDTNLDVLKLVSTALENLNDWTVESLETTLRDLTKSHELKLGQILQPLRSALTGRAVSPPIFEVVFHLGKDSTLTRIEQAILAGPQA